MILSQTASQTEVASCHHTANQMDAKHTDILRQRQKENSATAITAEAKVSFEKGVDCV